VADDPPEEHGELVPVQFLAGRGRRGQDVGLVGLGPLCRGRFGETPCVVVGLGR
jgi:hypothetical protein